MELADILVICMVTSIEVYFSWIVWSYYQQIQAGEGSEAALKDLLVNKDESRRMRFHHMPKHCDGGSGLQYYPGSFGASKMLDGYEAIQTAGLGGSKRIFGGTVHETNYPPQTA